MIVGDMPELLYAGREIRHPLFQGIKTSIVQE